MQLLIQILPLQRVLSHNQRLQLRHIRRMQPRVTISRSRANPDYTLISLNMQHILVPWLRPRRHCVVQPTFPSLSLQLDQIEIPIFSIHLEDRHLDIGDFHSIEYARV